MTKLDESQRRKNMGKQRLSRLSAIDVMNLHGLMKDYVVLGDKVDGVQYADYKAGWSDDKIALLGKERIGRRVSQVQVRNLRQSLFGVMRPRAKPQPKPIPELDAAGRLKVRIGALEVAIEELKEYQRDTRANYNELLDYVRKLDARVWALDVEWGSCRPAGYKPGLPGIINDTKEVP
jgi:hypothetical protein